MLANDVAWGQHIALAVTSDILAWLAYRLLVSARRIDSARISPVLPGVVRVCQRGF